MEEGKIKGKERKREAWDGCVRKSGREKEGNGEAIDLVTVTCY